LPPAKLFEGFGDEVDALRLMDIGSLYLSSSSTIASAHLVAIGTPKRWEKRCWLGLDDQGLILCRLRRSHESKPSLSVPIRSPTFVEITNAPPGPCLIMTREMSISWSNDGVARLCPTGSISGEFTASRNSRP